MRVAVAVVLVSVACSAGEGGTASPVGLTDGAGGSGGSSGAGNGKGVRLGDLCDVNNFGRDDAGNGAERLPECEELRAALSKALSVDGGSFGLCGRDLLGDYRCGFSCGQGGVEPRYEAICKALGGTCVENRCELAGDGG